MKRKVGVVAAVFALVVLSFSLIFGILHIGNDAVQNKIDAQKYRAEMAQKESIND